jgi:hypothetical protein
MLLCTEIEAELKGGTSGIMLILDRLAKTWHEAVVGALLLGFVTYSVCAEQATGEKLGAADIVRRAAAQGLLAFKLTTPDELKVLLGPATNEVTKNDGDMETLVLAYPGVHAIFGKMRRDVAPFALWWVDVGEDRLDIGQDRRVVLRNEDDLKKLDRFWGFVNVSLANLDLRGHRKLLETMTFDSQTVWPESSKMPEKFDPAVVLEEAKNPGLGLRSLHSKGIDGRGVGIAIIDG